MKKVWDWIKLQWAKLVAAAREYTWQIKGVTRGLDGINTPDNRVWLVVPSLFTRGNKETATVDIGVVWFGFGVKLNIERKK